MKRYVFLSVAILTAASTMSQPLRVGIVFDAGTDFHITEFQSLPGTFSCSPGFSTSVGHVWEIGTTAMIPQLASAIGLPSVVVPTFRLSYDRASVQFTAREHQPIALDASFSTATIEHRASVEFSRTKLTIGASTHVADNLYIEAGLWAAYAFVAPFEQGEYLVEPSDRGRFAETGTRTRNVVHGQFTARAPFQFGATAVAGWNVARIGRTTIRPEASISLPLTSAVTGLSWRTFSARAGIALLLPLPERVSPSEQRTDPPPYVPNNEPTELTRPEQPTLRLDVDFVAMDSSGRLVPVDSVTVLTRKRQIIRPLLPYVFFDEGSSTLPSRYVRLEPSATATFDESIVAGQSTLEAYYNLLNIIGARMRRMPDAVLTITGCTMGVGSESNRLDLALERAKSIRDYLHDVWAIDTARLRLVARNLPAHPSFVGHPDGNAENARAELSSTSAALLEPIVGTDEEYIVSPASVFVRMHSNVYRLDQWQWRVVSGQTTLAEQRYHGKTPSLVRLSVPWQSIAGDTVRVELAGTITASSSVASDVLTIHRRSESTRADIEQYSLILFDFDDATIPSSQQPMLDSIRRRIEPDTRVRITGYTDRLGDAEHNQRLAERRATAVARALGVSSFASIRAEGSRTLLYDNSLPEGRFYSRTIQIELDHRR